MVETRTLKTYHSKIPDSILIHTLIQLDSSGGLWQWDDVKKKKRTINIVTLNQTVKKETIIMH